MTDYIAQPMDYSPAEWGIPDDDKWIVRSVTQEQAEYAAMLLNNGALPVTPREQLDPVLVRQYGAERLWRWERDDLVAEAIEPVECARCGASTFAAAVDASGRCVACQP